jgi:phosphomannomutase
MSSKRVETREDLLKKFYDKNFENLSEDIQQIIEEIIKKQQEEEDAKKLSNIYMDKYSELMMDKYSKLIKKNISNKHNIKNNYNNIDGGSSNINDLDMKNIKDICKANQIKLSTIINNKRVVYTKKELITKLKRKRII